MESQKHDLSPQDLGITHFTPTEFRGWWGFIDPRWLICADLLRERVGWIIEVSPVEGAIGRHKGEHNTSDHNVDHWGRVYGVDLLPCYPHQTKTAIMALAYEFYTRAVECGFTAIGYYPDWKNARGKPSPGFHLGSRRNRKPGDPATWGRLRKHGNGGYDDVALVAALQATTARLA